MKLNEIIREGNAKEFAVLYDIFHKRVYYFVLKSTQSQVDAEDLCQGIFLKIWENRNKLSPEIPLENQIFQIARSLVIDYYRAKTAQKKILANFTKRETEEPSQLEVDPQKVSSLKKAIDELPSKRKEIFKLSRFHGLSYEEIAEELSISKNTVHSQISKALNTLRKKLAS